MDTKEMIGDFEAILKDKTTGSSAHDFELRRTVAVLGLAVLKLNWSSTLLAGVNILLALVLVVIGGIQICLMMRH